VNTATDSPGLFFRDSNNSLVKVGPVHVGTTAPNASPASGGTAGNSVGEQWLDTSSSRYVFKIWDGSAWRSEAGEFVDVAGDVMTGALGIIAGSAGSPGLYFSGDTNTGLYSPGADQVAISTNGTKRLSIDSTGFVELFDNDLYLTKTGLGNGQITFNGSTFSFTSNSSTAPIVFGTASQERMRLDSSGRLGLGTSSPEAALDVRGAVQGGNGTIKGQISYSTRVEMGAVSNHNLGFITNSTTQMLLDTSGRLGIGTTSPTQLLSLAGTSANILLAGTSNSYTTYNINSSNIGYVGDANWIFGGSSSDFGVRATSNLVFGIGANERARIDSSGRLLVGLTTGTPSTTVFGTAIASVFTHSRDTAGSGAVAQFYGNAGEFRVLGNGNVQNTNNSYGAISDAKLKENIEAASSQWDDLKALEVVNFNFIGSDQRQIGLVAQQVELISPGLVEDVADDEAGTTSTKGVKYSVLYIKAVKALQEAMERIEALETRIAAAGI
jgi:hypothetical protein